MDFGEILRIIRKRWYVALPGAFLALVITVSAYVVVPTKYESQATFSLINSPRPVTAPGNGNPFLTFESSLTATADFLARSLTAEESARELAGMGVTEEYTAALADNAMGPFITLTVTGTDPGHVLRSTTVLTDYAKRKLRAMQERSGAPETSMIQAVVIIEPQPPQPVIKSKIQVVAGLAGLLVTITLAATFLTESVARARRRPDRPDRPVAAPEPPERRPAIGTVPRHLDPFDGAPRGLDPPAGHARGVWLPRPATGAESAIHAER